MPYLCTTAAIALALLSGRPGQLRAQTAKEGSSMTRPHCDVLVFNDRPARDKLHNLFRQEPVTPEGYPSVRVLVTGLPQEAPARLAMSGGME